MVNIPIDPQPFVSQGLQIQQIQWRNGVTRVVLPPQPRRHEDWAITTIQPLPDEVHFPNDRDVLGDFLQNDPDAQVGFREIQPCPFGEAYVQFRHICDRDRMVTESPHAFGDVFISFTKHNEGISWHRVHFNGTCWLLFIGVPFDFCNSEDIAVAISKWGKIISWERERGCSQGQNPGQSKSDRTY